MWSNKMQTWFTVNAALAELLTMILLYEHKAEKLQAHMSSKNLLSSEVGKKYKAKVKNNEGLEPMQSSSDA